MVTDLRALALGVARAAIDYIMLLCSRVFTAKERGRKSVAALLAAAGHKWSPTQEHTSLVRRMGRKGGANRAKLA